MTTRGIEKKFKEKEDLKKDLIYACDLFGWDENNEFDSIVHAKNFLRACKRFNEVNFYDFSFFLKNTLIPIIEENSALKITEKEDKKVRVQRVYNSIELYAKYVQEGKSRGLKGYEGQETIDYANIVMREIKEFLPVS
jgi:hypothetical protein